MPIGTTGAQAPTPWYATLSPWPWFGGNQRAKSTISVGNPQHVLPAGSERFGFSIDVRAGVSSNASGSCAGAQPATVNNVINAYAAQFASAPAFAKRPAYE